MAFSPIAVIAESNGNAYLSSYTIYDDASYYEVSEEREMPEYELYQAPEMEYYENTYGVYEYLQDDYISYFVDEEPQPFSSGFYAVNVRNARQPQSNWCWATSSVVCLNFLGNSFANEHAFVFRVFGEAVNRTATVFQTADGIRSFGQRATEGVGLSPGIVQSEISARRPIIAGYMRSGATTGHMVVISGIDTWNGVYEVMDPAVGRRVHYTTAQLSTASNAPRRWVVSIRF